MLRTRWLILFVLSWVTLVAITPLKALPPNSTSMNINTKFLHDLAETRNFTLGRPVNPQPTPAGDAVIFLRAKPRLPVLSLYQYSLSTGQTQELLTPAQLLKGASETLSAAEQSRRERQRITAQGFTSFAISPDGKSLLVSLAGKAYLVDRTTLQVRELPLGRGTLIDPRFAPDSSQIAYILDYDLYTLNLKTFTRQQITKGGNEDITHGLAEFVAQEEMDRDRGYWWSPDQHYLAYEIADARAVELWQVSDPANPGIQPVYQRYPRPGHNNVVVKLGIIKATGGKTTLVQWDQQRYPYLVSVHWDKGSPLTLLVQDRLQHETALLTADVHTGKTQSLLREHSTTWIEADQHTPLWLADGSGFIWSSDRAESGGWQVELRNAQGQLQRVLVTAQAGYRPTNGLSLDTKSRQLYYHASPDPTQVQLWRVGLDKSEAVPLSTEAGLYKAVYSDNHQLSVYSYSGLHSLRRTTVHGADGQIITELPSVAEEPPFIPTTEIIKVGEGEGFYTAVTRPRDFDPARKYPVIDSVYGGPGFQRVTAAMGSYLNDQWLADQGFVVISADGRGTPGRGHDWEHAIYGNLADMPLLDQVAVLTALAKQLPQVDLTHIGITGSSFGGYLSALAVLRRPDIFKAAVAKSSVADWLDYDTYYTERYLGLPQDNPAGYQASSLLTYAPKLSQPLLLIHGTADDNVYFLHSLKLSQALFLASQPHTFLPLSGLTHQINSPMVQERLGMLSINFFREHLGFK